MTNPEAANLPLVSIVTPSLNQEEFIAATIDSVISQDYPCIEYLVVDGSSTDGTLEILRCYGKQLRWISEPDGGQAAAINKGWQRTHGEIVTWLNSDDLYFPGAVKQAVEFLRSHPKVDALYGNCDYIDALGQFIKPYPTRPYDYLDLVRGTVNFIPQPATFIRRSVLEKVGFLDEHLNYVMDLDCWLRLGVEHTMAYLPQKLAALRLHPEAKSVQAAERFGSELIGVYRRLFVRPDLPQSVRSIEARTMSNVYYQAASWCFWAGEVRLARRYVLTAWKYAPNHLRRSLFLILGLGSLGRPGLRLAKGLRRAARISAGGTEI